MKLNKNHIRRAVVYSFYDPDGVVDGYVIYFLEEIRKSCDYLIVISNGILPGTEKEKLRQCANRVIERENSGFDIWGYKTGLDYIGWDRVKRFDEIVLCNNTLMGPVCPFSDMFSEMAQKDLDFWGIARHYSIPFDPFGCIEYGYVPEHIQSYFMVFRESMFNSFDFQEYWNELPLFRGYEEAVGLHEAVFTKKFADKGFVWDTYVDTSDIAYLTDHPILVYPTLLIKEKHCPVFKKRTFFQPYDWVLRYTAGQAAPELMRYLETSTAYPTDFIWDNLLRTCHQADIVRTLALNYTISTEKCSDTAIRISEQKKIILIMHLYYADLIPESYSYACAMPSNADIYITTNTEEKQKLIEKQFSQGDFNHVEVRVIANRGRDVSSLLVGVKDVIMNYDIACFVHDKKSAQVDPGSVGDSFSYLLFSNSLCNKEFVYNVIELFENHPRLGILSPPLPNHGDYYSNLGKEWGMDFENFENSRKLAEELDFRVPLDKNKEAVAPYGTVFWFRPQALSKLYAKDWEYSDFPPEPNKVDGTILHAVERLYPYAAQAAGFHPAIVMSDRFAALEYAALQYYVREYNLAMSGAVYPTYFHAMRDELRNIGEKVSSCEKTLHAWEEDHAALLSIADRWRH